MTRAGEGVRSEISAWISTLSRRHENMISTLAEEETAQKHNVLSRTAVAVPGLVKTMFVLTEATYVAIDRSDDRCERFRSGKSGKTSVT